MVNRYTPLCIACSRCRFDGTCDAFPDGIPEEIGMGMFDHREPHAGDNGIRFELRLGVREDLAHYEASKAQFESDRLHWVRDRRAAFRLIHGGR